MTLKMTSKIVLFGLVAPLALILIAASIYYGSKNTPTESIVQTKITISTITENDNCDGTPVKFYTYDYSDIPNSMKLSKNTEFCFHNFESTSSLDYNLNQMAFNKHFNSVEIAFSELTHGLIFNNEYTRLPDIPDCPNYANLVYSDEFGTILIGGYHKYQWTSSVVNILSNNENGDTVKLPSLNTGRGKSSTVYQNSKIYVVGGFNSNVFNGAEGTLRTIEVLDLGDLNNKWIEIGRLREPRRGHNFVIFEDSIYAFCGYNGTDYRVTSMEKFGLIDGKSTIADDLMSYRYQPVSFLTSKDSLFIFGGEDSKKDNILETGDLEMKTPFTVAITSFSSEFYADFVGKRLGHTVYETSG